MSDTEPIVLDPDDPAFRIEETAGAHAPVPLPPLLLRNLLAYAQGRLAAGEGVDVQRRMGFDHPVLVAAYRPGYLPASYHDALSKEDRKRLAGQRLGNRLILPASDATGQVVDFLALKLDARGQVGSTATGAEPLGLLAPNLITAHDELLITDAMATLIECVRQGFPNTLLLRGVADARLNASRLAHAGVRRVIIRTRHDAGGIPDALAAAGIDVSGRTAVAVPSIAPEAAFVREAAPAYSAAPPPPDRLRILSEDRTAEVVLVEAGPVRYAVERHQIGDDPRRLVVIRVQGQVAQDRLDLAAEVQCRRFAGNAGQKLGLAADVIAAHLAQLGPLLTGHASAAAERHLAAVPDAERSDAEAMLTSPDLLSRIGADLTALGWMGEDRAKALLYLTGISRLLPQPLWTVYRSTAGAAPWQGTALVAALTPPEERLVFHRLTDAAIRQHDATQLRHRLIVLDQAECLRPEASLVLRVLKERGGIGWATLAADAIGDARGPVAVLAATAADLDPRCRDCFVAVPADDRPEQTAQVLAEQRRQHGAGLLPAAHQAGIVARHHALQRLLRRLPVIIPDANRLVFPAAQVRHRVEQAWFLALVEAIALLHERQRAEQGGAIVATAADIGMAMHLAEGVLAADRDGLSRQGRHLLGVITSHRLPAFTMADLADLVPDWTRWTFRAALQDLLDFGYLESPPSGRGKPRAFTLTTRSAAAASAPAIRLRIADGASAIGHDEMHQVGGLAEVGGSAVANFIPEVACG